MSKYHCPECGKTVNRPDKRAIVIKSYCEESGQDVLMIRIKSKKRKRK